MTTVFRLDPFLQMLGSDLQKQIEGALSDESALSKWSPNVDMRENESAYLMHAELPGMKKDDISVDLRENILVMTGEKTKKKKEDNEKIHMAERSYGKFTRKFPLPKNADADNIEASFEDGVLELNIPKLAPAKPDVKKIDIKGGSSVQSK